MADTKDYGANPYVLNIEEATKENDFFRVCKWTGNNFQLTLMSIEPGDDIGLEVHNDHDQFLRIEEGIGFVQMGATPEDFLIEQDVEDDDAILVPAGYWHNITNTGTKALKIYSIYAPAEHEHGTIHQTKEDAEEAEALHHQD